MRSLKFRIWSERYKEFVRPDYNLLGFCYPLDGSIAVIGSDGRVLPNHIVEQYTGLKDKNGKEIYEGDIVDYNDDGECIGVVEYDAPEFCLNADATNWARMFLKGAPHQRVIGNIHENKELLESAK